MNEQHVEKVGKINYANLNDTPGVWYLTTCKNHPLRNVQGANKDVWNKMYEVKKHPEGWLIRRR